jgi:hypothetical protein
MALQTRNLQLFAIVLFDYLNELANTRVPALYLFTQFQWYVFLILEQFIPLLNSVSGYDIQYMDTFTLLCCLYVTLLSVRYFETVTSQVQIFR